MASNAIFEDFSSELNLISMQLPVRPELAKALAELNDEQRAAVDQTEGPVMVIAGPGTGKTQILAARIGRILNHPDLGDIRPEQVLCLTYTDAGAVAMRQRLLSFIGTDAYRVGIYTFHSFCNKVIQDRPEQFGMREMDPISELEEVTLLREIIDGLASNSPLKRWGPDPYYEIKRLRSLFKAIKQEGWPLDTMRHAIRDYLEDLPNRDEYRYKRKTGDFAKGDLKVNAISELTEKMDMLREAIDLFEVYEAAMKKSRRYDFQDMIAWVRTAFDTNENLLLDYQEQFLYVLVDEYQDTNGSQNAILQLLTNYWNQPNVFVVGDDDQSIYRFQGASVANIVEFQKKYQAEGLSTVVLEKNYRSSQTILDSAAALIRNNTERLVNEAVDGHPDSMSWEKKLLARNKEYADNPNRPVVTQWFNDAHETVGIARAIELLVGEGTSPKEIAVIYRKHNQAEPIIAYLQQLGIAVQVKRRMDLLQSIFTRNVLMIFDYINRESKSPGAADEMLYEMMHLGSTGRQAATIADMTWSLREVNKKPGTNIRWREYLLTRQVPANSPTLFDTEKQEQEMRVSVFQKNLESWLSNFRDWTLQGLFERVVVDGGVMAWVLQHPDRIALLEELNTLFDYIKSETSKKPLLDLNGFMTMIQTLREESLSLPVNRNISTAEGVNFLTAHGSKGLEFDHVYILGADEKAWDKSPGGSDYKLPDTLVRSNEGSEIEESRRLFYVAMTRARKSLNVSFARQDNAGKDKNQSRFVAELQESKTVEFRETELPPEQITGYWEKFVQPAPTRTETRTPQEEMAMRTVLQNFQLSVTNLNKYLRCPKSFYYETMLKIPSAKNRHMAFGTAVHVALEMYFRRMLEDPEKNWPHERELLGWFESYMGRHRDSFTESEFRQDMDRGRRALPLFVNSRKGYWNKVVLPERNLNNVVFQGVPLRGKLDRIEFDGNTAIVVDYKTGKHRPEKFKAPKPGAEEGDKFEVLRGGDYWRQAVFYKILVDHDPAHPAWKAHQSVFEFVEPEKNGTDFKVVPVVITEGDVELVGQQIEEVWSGIQALNFDRGCQEEYCRWCNFEQSRFLHLKEPVEQDELELN